MFWAIAKYFLWNFKMCKVSYIIVCNRWILGIADSQYVGEVCTQKMPPAENFQGE